MSGIYIKGMEMPTCCGECRFLSEYGDYPCCIITDEQRGYNFRIREMRMPHCPLIPVPDHGDLIDRDAALYKLGRIVLPDDLAYTIGHDMAKRFFEKAPTIIPADKEGEA